MQNLTLVTFGYHDRGSPRYVNVCRDFEKEGYRIIECHTDKSGLRAKCKDLKAQWNNVKDGADALLVTFPGHYLVPLAWKLTRRPRKKLIFDAFISLSDSLVSDRRKYSWINPFSWYLYLVDFVSCHLADEILIDTKAHAEFFAKRFLLSREKIKVMYLGSREDLFFPKQTEKNGKTILFYGSYIPLQGIEYIIEAAAILQKTNSELQFTMIGSGQTYPAIKKKANSMNLRNLTFRSTVRLEELPELMRKADVCLGIFGKTDKAARVIPHKVYDAVACNVPVITRDSPAIREKFTDGKDVFLCKPANSEDLAQTIIKVLGMSK